MHVVIACYDFGFPNGYGASSRICNYALGLSELGAKVRVLCLKASEVPGTSILNHEASGQYHGVPFEYTGGRSLNARTRLGRWCLNLRGLVGARCALRRARQEAPIDAVLLYRPDSLLYSVAMRLLAWEVEARLLGETTEEPFVNERPGGVRDLKKLVFDRFTLRLFTGFVVISRHLESRIQPFLSPRAPILRLPVLVDTPRFAREGSKMRLPLGTIGYCGHLSHTGEAEFLLKAWSLVASAFPSGRLKIIGEHPDPQVFAQLKSLVAILRVEASVEFMGAVTRAELPSILAQADVMALPRADGLFSRAGMPNKLGEYLATGRPVVVTSTGDIGSYLEDRVSAYLVPPGDTVAFAEALRYVLAHPQDAAEVGRRGQAVAQEHLDMRRNCARLLEFIAGIGR